MITTLKNWLDALKNWFAGSPAQPATDEETLAHQPTLPLNERFELEDAPNPTEAEDAATMDADLQILDYEQAAVLARAASQKYGVMAVHVDPINARVRVSDTGADGTWFWAEDETVQP